MSQFEKKILVLEDESVTAFNLEETLNKIGYKNVDVALSIETALNNIQTCQYDLLLLDINVGTRYSGIDFAEQVKATNEELPIMFLTGNSDPLTVAKAGSVEPRAYLIKPFNEHEIRVNLDLVFQNSPQKTRRVAAKNELRFSKTFLDHHPNLVMRVDVAGTILMVNPVISRVSGGIPEEYLSKKVIESALDVTITNLIQESLSKAENRSRKFTCECQLGTVMGARLMFVVVIPELNEEKKLASIILVFQDITDQKIATDELMLRNKKIVDSINYSKRIQQALLPTTTRLQHYLPDSSILLKPKDVVSGDFPWVYKRKDYLYIAAIDCTGHGVPGALMSIIIHFLLNEILRAKDDLLPGDVLELLHLYTRKTLKQHMPGVESNDGADVGLCRVNLKTNEVYYSGAHRPMLFVQKGEITEIKGDRQPIGGEQYSKKKKRLKFANNLVLADSDTKMIIFSDGLSDQFGGEELPKRKFGTSQVRHVLEKCLSENSSETLVQLEKEFTAWKGGQKQLDDVLAICFKLDKAEIQTPSS